MAHHRKGSSASDRKDDSTHLVVEMQAQPNNGHEGRHFHGTATGAGSVVSRSHPAGSQSLQPINLTLNMVSPPPATNTENPNQDKKMSLPEGHRSHARAELDVIADEGKKVEPSNKPIKDRLFQLTSDELCEIVLSLCMESDDVNRRVIGAVDSYETKETSTADEFLVIRLLMLDQVSLVAIILGICMADPTGSVEKFIRRLLDGFEAHKKLTSHPS
ncbi:uncharacterized protein GGS22DRAFT_184964 [Annulohypoxylon maeteangense]|uniref:uncharacterized protein n=1 Tax=Annulohypoxylon maeteangense TaxID=1927788 RepID=UPI00200786A5|nr:uncharacterized protein GGS22DRAFT_184964 [Annulohypoxylon maeteangense]KAI0889386.1 hypothetical protein GGS22DRAFT_184964 [Annulohypoxylon maeteangense]